MSRAAAIVKLLGRVASETNLKEAEKKVASRPKGKVSLEPEQALPEDITMPGAEPQPIPAGPSEGQKVIAEPIKVEPPLTKPARSVLEEKPLSDDELTSLLDAADTPLEGKPQYTNMNLNRVNTIEEIGSVADRMIKLTVKRGEGIGDRVTHEKIKKGSLKVEWGTITNKQREGVSLTADELLASREVEARLMSDIKRRASEQIDAQASGTLTDEMVVTLREDAAKVMAISRYIRGETRRTAQILNSMAIPVDGSSSISARMRNELLESPGVRKSNKQMLESILASDTTDDMLKALDERGFAKRWGSRAGNAWFNVVLSKFALGKAMVGGTVVGKGILPAERLISSMLFKVFPKMADNQPAWNGKVQAGEAFIELFGWLNGLKESFGPLVRSLQDPEFDLGKAKLQRPKFDYRDTMYSSLKEDAGPIQRYSAQVVDGLLQNGSMRAMKMNDWIVRSAIGMSRAKAMAYRVAANEGLNEKDLLKRVKQLIDDMPDEMYDDMIESGDAATLTQTLSTPSKAILKAIDSAPLMGFVLAFTKTALAAIELGLERLPGIAQRMPRLKGAWEKGGAARADLISKQVLGTSLMGAGIYAYYSGEATSGITLSKKERQSRQTLGWKPYSTIDEKGNYSSWNFLSPVHELYMIGVGVGEFIDYANEGIPPGDPRYKSWEEVGIELAQTAIFSFVDIYLNKSVGRSFREMMDALQDPATSGKYKTVSMLTPLLVPVAGMSHVVGAVDDVYRRVPSGTFFDQMTDEFKKRIPWLSKELLPQVGYFGEEVKLNGFGLGMLAYREGDPNAELASELYANDVMVRRPNKFLSLSGVRINLDLDINPDMITDAELEENPDLGRSGYAYYRYSKIRGEIYRENLNKLIKSSEYKNSRLPYGPPGDEALELTRGDLIQGFMVQLNTLARLEFEKEFSGKIDLVKLASEIRIRRSAAGVKAFVPPGIDKQLKGIQKEEREATARRQEMARKLQGVNF